jgi:phosphoribosylamine---glycine ligase
VLARLGTPIAGVLHAAATGRLAEVGPLEWSEGAAVTVVVAAEGYPEAPVAGGVVHGLDLAAEVDGAHVLHAGTAVGADGNVVVTGGRVLSVVGTGATVADARLAAYAAVGRISLAGSHHRTDIAAAV